MGGAIDYYIVDWRDVNDENLIHNTDMTATEPTANIDARTGAFGTNIKIPLRPAAQFLAATSVLSA
jgi:hypothetical protein